MTFSRIAAALLSALLASGPSLAHSDDAGRNPPPGARSDPSVQSAPARDAGDQKAAIITLLLMLARERGATSAAPLILR
jgi:hypothetical protein